VIVDAQSTKQSGYSPIFRTWKRLSDATSCSVCIGAEIEFYLDSAAEKYHDEILRKYSAKLARQGLPHSVKREVGDCQYEVVLHPSYDPIFVAQGIDHIKALGSELGITEGCRFSFAAREQLLSPPSALHINVSLVNTRGCNTYAKVPGTGPETEIMQHSIAGLCEFMNASMKFFAPTEDSFKRFTRPFAGGPYAFANAPATVSWGGDNRTVAIRIPASSRDPNSRHIEHRVPCADAEPIYTIASILAGIAYGVEQCIPLRLAKVWGNAYEVSGLVPLVHSLPEAIALYEDCAELRRRL
jgi:glutamine synthetase